MNVNFTINNDAFKESETQKISNVYLVLEYDNPQAYGFPEVAHWKKTYSFDMNNLRKQIKEQQN